MFSSYMSALRIPVIIGITRMREVIKYLLSMHAVFNFDAIQFLQTYYLYNIYDALNLFSHRSVCTAHSINININLL